MKRTLDALLKHYGNRTTLIFSDRETTLRAFLRPVTTKSLQSLRHEMDELGQIPGGQYLFLGPPDCGLAGAEMVVCGGVRYLPRRVETLLLGDEPCCVWGYLTRGGDEDGGAA